MGLISLDALPFTLVPGHTQSLSVVLNHALDPFAIDARLGLITRGHRLLP
jgi:hypothetical protein